MFFRRYCFKKLVISLPISAFACMCIGQSSHANPISYPNEKIFSNCVVAVSLEYCAAAAMAISLCNARKFESQGIKRSTILLTEDYLDHLSTMNIKENELLNAQFSYSGIVTKRSGEIMTEICPSFLKSKSEGRPIFIATLESTRFGVYRESMLRIQYIRAKADADCKNQESYNSCFRARYDYYAHLISPLFE